MLGDCEKLDESATAYYNKVKSLTDTLSSIGQPLVYAEFTFYVVNGLDEEYDGLVAVVNDRTTPLMGARALLRSLLGLSNDGKDTRNNERQVYGDRPAPKHQDHQGRTQCYPINPHWYMDTGATDHLTNELGHLDTLEPYHGSDKVHTAKAPMEQERDEPHSYRYSPEPRWRTTPSSWEQRGDEDGGGDGSGVDGEALGALPRSGSVRERETLSRILAS
ncbi:hypothetical protein QYE76_047651 [Lolium multiflorum]|uniref:Uncharacterized protein n=1 Tax=Lolium multiflorum TaxID=4521 RepID=A0AAD8TRY6_LOLMU|nr:hypothetical protein QYE76_047651 [Lolium multiflorum]